MNAIAISFAVAGLALVAGAGVVAGFLREAPVPIEPLADPLEERREALLRSLADLEEAHASGALDEAGYVRLREQTEGRIARVLRALDRRDSVTLRDPASAVPVSDVMVDEAPTGGRDVRPPSAEPRRVPAWAVAVIIGGTVLAVVVASLARDAEPQIQIATSPQTSDPLAFFEQRVTDHPDDLAARLDLAHRYLDAGMSEDALSEYAVALRLDPDDAEALAHVGIILYQAGRPQDALRSVERALSTDPRYPEALFFRGVILLRGLERPEEAITAFETYLDAAPFGVEREKAKDLIAEARDGLAGG
ncbi:MAG TPA: tetratricopeptide repeat protein [Actinomycetota bacterium]|nr:tetratricopeptide repeat protein [Actinomycetota bacterium]